MPTEPRNDDLVMSLVEQALGQASEHREAYLRSACSRDPRLFEQVWNYVKWEERMDGFLLNPLYPPPRNEHPFEPGQLLQGRFRIEREVAQGGMGVVYEAVDERLDRRIAIKCAKSGYHKRLPPEVRHASEISHPNVCKTYEIHTALTDEGEIDFLTMEFVEGETLAERLRDGALPPQEAQTVARQLCEGLAEAHRKQVVHGDLKTNNIILTQTAEGVRAVITDFGLARRPSSQQPAAQSGELGGAPDYMAPELLKGEKPSVASDIYALGVILYEMASGRRPFGVEYTWEERLEGRPEPLKHRWRHAVARCLEPDPSRRWTRAAEVARALAPPISRLWWGMAAAAGLALAILGATSYARLGPPPDTIRLAVLPFQADKASTPLSNGLLDDTADRLSKVKKSRAKLTVISLSDAIQNKVDQPEKAVKVLGATHTLSGTMRSENGRTLVHAYLTDARSQVRLQEWQAAYAPGELRNLPVALAGVVTGTLRLPPLAVTATVKPAAYVDFATGVSLTRRDTGVDAALPLLERAVQEDPDSALIYAGLAHAQMLKYRLTNDPSWQEKATASLTRAEQLNPDLVPVRLSAGISHRYQGLYDRAEADFRRALEIEPENGDAWRQLGQVYRDNSRFEEARAAFQRAIQVQPEYFKNYQNLCSLYSDQGDYQSAIPLCQMMVRLAPDLWEAHFALSLAYVSSDRYADGEAEARAAVRLQDKSSRALHGLGWALMIQDRNEEAIPYFTRAIEIGPATDLLYMDLGTCLRRARRLADAEEAYRRGLAQAEIELGKNPKDAGLHAELAYLCARLNQRSRSQSEAGQATQLAPGSVRVAWMLALTYEALGERDRVMHLAESLPDDTLRRMNRFPDLADLRADSRFQQLIQSHHLQ